MRGVYEATYAISSLSAAKTLMYITAPSNKTVDILSAHVTNTSNETNEQLQCVLQRISTLGTPTATSVTPAPRETGDQAAGSTVKGNVTASEPTYGSNTEVGSSGFASLAGWHYQPIPEERLTVTGADSWGLRMISTPTAFDALVTICFQERG